MIVINNDNNNLGTDDILVWHGILKNKAASLTQFESAGMTWEQASASLHWRGGLDKQLPRLETALQAALRRGRHILWRSSTRMCEQVATYSLAKPSQAQPSLANQGQAAPSQAQPSPAKPSQA